MPLSGPGFTAGPDVPKEQEKRAKKLVHGWKRAKKSKVFARGGQRVEKVLSRFPRKMWDFKPAEQHWCVGEVLWHLADQEANLYFRLRKAVADPGGSVPSWDQETWANRTNYLKADFEEGHKLFAMLRQANSNLLNRLPPSVWGNTISHPEFGRISVEYQVGHNIWHVEHHIGQMAKRYRQWKEKKK